MLLGSLRQQVLEANLELDRRGLVLYTFGNVSGISRDDGLVVIKPSGVPYERMTSSDMVVTDLDGSVVEGTLRASSDLPTHLEQGISRHRRRRSYPLRVCHGVGPGSQSYSL